jgi:hypothetical protein
MNFIQRTIDLAMANIEEGVRPFAASSSRMVTLANFYAEFARAWQDRTLPLTHAPHPGGIEVYRR